MLQRSFIQQTTIKSRRAFLRPGDWLCLNCQNLCPVSARTCESCNCLKQATSPLVGKWKCQKCKSENHSHRAKCWGCGYRLADQQKQHHQQHHRGGASKTTTSARNVSTASSSSSSPMMINPFSVMLNAKWKCRCGSSNHKAQNACGSCKSHKSLCMVRK